MAPLASITMVSRRQAFNACAVMQVGGDHADGGILTLHFRRDKKVSAGVRGTATRAPDSPGPPASRLVRRRHSRPSPRSAQGLAKEAKFACQERAALLAALFRCVAAATARGLSGLGPSLLGQPEVFPAFKLHKGQWRPAALRVTPWALERLDPGSGLARWRLEFRHAAAPFVRLLLASEGQPPGVAAFAVFGKAGRSPRVYAARDREALLRAAQAAALRRSGLTLAVDSNAQTSGAALLAMVAAAERERAASPSEAPLAEWEVMRVYEADALATLPRATSAAAAAGKERRGLGTGRPRLAGSWARLSRAHCCLLPPIAPLLRPESPRPSRFAPNSRLRR